MKRQLHLVVSTGGSLLKLFWRPFWLFVFVFTACTTATPSVTTTTPYNLILPTPLASDVRLQEQPSTLEPSTPAPIATAVPTLQAVASWQTYRDPIHGIGLAYPAHWEQRSSGEQIVLDNGCGRETAVLLRLTGFSIGETETTPNWLYAYLGEQNRIVESVEQVYTGNYPSLLANIKDNAAVGQIETELIVRLTPQHLLLIQFSTSESWALPDVQAIFASLAAPSQPITIPAAPPSSLAVPCTATALPTQGNL